MPETARNALSAPTSRDVAQMAGVSQKTVSRVLNDERYVSADARAKVLSAASRLGFRPNSAARALASGRSRSIGVVSLDTDLYGPSRILVGLERAARDLGYSLRVASTQESDPGSSKDAVRVLLEQRVDGIVVSEPIDESREPIRLNVPMVAFGTATGFTSPLILSAGIRSDALARAATDHLLDLGHPTVHHLAGPLRWFAASDRTDGWREALDARNRSIPPILRGDWSARSGYLAGSEVIEHSDITAVFAANDEMAVGLIRALTEAGVRVPEDVSVVGFDDIPVSAYTSPPLTTVRPAFDAVALDAVELLVHAIEQPQTALPIRPQRAIELVVRGSTATPHRARFHSNSRDRKR